MLKRLYPELAGCIAAFSGLLVLGTTDNPALAAVAFFGCFVSYALGVYSE